MLRIILISVLLLAGRIGYAQIISNFAGTGAVGFGSSGIPAVNTIFNSLSCVAAANDGNVYISDSYYGVYQVNPAGIINLYAGNGFLTFAGDGGPATAAAVGNHAILAVDPIGNLYIAEAPDRVRKVNYGTGIINTIAGNGSCVYGLVGDGGPALMAEICGLGGLAASNTRVYTCQQAYQVARLITGGNIYAYAGYFYTVPSTYNGDGGPAPSAQLHSPAGIAIDPAGNLYIVDAGRRVIRKVNTSGIISTYAGNDTLFGTSGDGGPATAASFDQPFSVAADGNGNIFVSDVGSNVIRRINSAGIISTYVGTGVAGNSGDGGPAAMAKINYPWYIAADLQGNLYFVDAYNNRVRKVAVTNNVVPAFVGGYIQHFGLCVNAPATSINGIMTINDADAGENETWDIVTPPAHGTLGGFPLTLTSTSGSLTPSGLTYMPATGYSGSDTFKIRISDDTSVNYTTVYVTVDGVPNPGFITSADTVCVALPVALTASVPGGTWSVTNALATVAGTVLTGVTAGTDTVVYSVTNACTTSTTTQSVIINPIASPGSITGSPTACVGAVTTLLDMVMGGTWSMTNGNATITSGGAVTGVFIGNDTARYMVTLGVCHSYALWPMSVIDGPATAGVITGSGDVCFGAPVNLSASIPSGVWSSSNTSIATVLPLVGTVSAVSIGVVTISYTISNSCGNAFTTHNMNAGCTVGIDDIDTDAHLVISPNPNKGNFTISGMGNHIAGSLLIVTDLLGKEITRQTLINDEVNINVQSGVYLLSVYNSGNRYNTLVVVQ